MVAPTGAQSVRLRIEMTTATLPLAARRNVALFTLAESLSFQPKMRFAKTTNAAGVEVDALILEDVPVFRSGTFRDMMGFQHTWEDIHIDQMVSHFDLLRNRGIFRDVPTRRGHGALFADPIDNVIGYHTALRSERRTNQVDGEEYLFLLAGYEVLDPTAIEKISSTLWRNLSAEVGSFLTNNETEFWPVYHGVAYVDIPAVEGLKQFSRQTGFGETFSVMLNTDKEAPVSGNANTGTQQTATPPTPPVPPPAPPVQPPAPQMDPAAFARASFMFTINGRQTNDFSAVQAHIATLEGAANEAKAANRRMFIKGLAEGPTPRILAPQIEGIEGYALTLDDDAWAKFESSWGVAPATPVTGQHGAPVNGTTPASVPEGAGTGTAGEIEVAAEIVRQHRRSNMPTKALEATASFRKLKALDPTNKALLG